MTAEEKEIRKAEQKALAEVRRWRRIESKKLAAMTPEERQEYWRKGAEESKARGFNIG